MPPPVAVVGLGGLGSPAVIALAEAGIPHLRLIDFDAVELSNLPRQPLYGLDDLGSPKTEVAARRLASAFPSTRVTVHATRLEKENGRALLAGSRVILDATDGLAAKILLNELAIELDVALVHAGVLGLDGQLMTILPGKTACLRCLFLEPPDAAELPSCEQAGVLGPVVGAVGFAAAREAWYVAGGHPPPLANRLAILDGLKLRWRVVDLRRNPRCPLCATHVPSSDTPRPSPTVS